MSSTRSGHAITVSGGTVNGGIGNDNTKNDYSINDYRTQTTRNEHQGTVNNFGNANNVNTGTNHGTISQDDNRDETPPRIRDGYAQQAYGYPHGYRPPHPHPQSAPPAQPYWQEEAQYYGRPPYQPQFAYPTRGYPTGSPPYQGRGYYGGAPPQGSPRYHPEMYPIEPRNAEFPRAGMGEPHPADGYYNNLYEGEEFNPRGAVPVAARGLTPASHPQARSDMTPSAPPSVASSSNASAHGATPSRKSKNPFKEFPP